MHTLSRHAPRQLLLITLAIIFFLADNQYSTYGVDIVRHATTRNCQDPGQRCNDIAELNCCAFSDIGASSVQFSGVTSPNVLAVYAPDIRSTNMCKYVLKKQRVRETTVVTYCVGGEDITGAAWRQQSGTGINDINGDTQSHEVLPYGLKCTSHVNATLPAIHSDNVDEENNQL